MLRIMNSGISFASYITVIVNETVGTKTSSKFAIITSPVSGAVLLISSDFISGTAPFLHTIIAGTASFRLTTITWTCRYTIVSGMASF